MMLLIFCQIHPILVAKFVLNFSEEITMHNDTVRIRKFYIYTTTWSAKQQCNNAYQNAGISAMCCVFSGTARI
jgi:hypothetical protein